MTLRVPRIHRFATAELPDELFRRLPAANRFRFAGGRSAPTAFGAEPVRTVRHRPDRTDGSPLRGDEFREALPRVPAVCNGLGFPGGAVGWIAYERGYAVEELALGGADPAGPPELWFGVYDTFARWEAGEVEVVSWGLTEEGGFDEALALRRATRLEERLRSGSGRTTEEPGVMSETRASLDREGHAHGVESILEAIARGDLYQANLTIRFEVDYQGPGVGLFERLLRDNPAPFGAFVEGRRRHGHLVLPGATSSGERSAARSAPDQGNGVSQPGPVARRVAGPDALRVAEGSGRATHDHRPAPQ